MEQATDELLRDFQRKFDLPLSNSLRVQKLKELELDLLYVLTPSNFAEQLLNHNNELAILDQNWVEYDESSNLVSVNETELGDKKLMHEINDLFHAMTDEFSGEYISNDLHAEYLNREVRLCELLDELDWYNPSWKDYDPDDELEENYSERINQIRKIQSQLAWILELAKEQAIWVQPVLTGLPSVNFDNLTKKNTQKKPKARTTAQKRLKYSLFLLRRRVSGIQRNDEVPELLEILCIA